MQPSTPHQTIASFFGLDGRWSQRDCKGIRWAAARRCRVMGHESRYAHGRRTLGSAVLAHFCSLGFHTSGSRFNMPVSVITETRVSASSFGPRRPALPPRSVVFADFQTLTLTLKSRRPHAVTYGRARDSGVNGTAGNGPVRCQTCHFSWSMARMCWVMSHCVEETVKVISDRPCQ